MIKIRLWKICGIILITRFQIVLQDQFESTVEKERISNTNEKSSWDLKYHEIKLMTIPEARNIDLESKITLSRKKNGKHKLKEGEYQRKSTVSTNAIEAKPNAQIFERHHRRSTPDNSSSSQFQRLCIDIGSQPCTCYHPDHSDVTKFELSTDEIALKATDVINGTGPGNCTDLKTIGHTLNGFYMVRFNSKRIQSIYCEFKSVETTISKETVLATVLENIDDHSRIPKNNFRCGNFKTDVTNCTFLYSDYPDAPKFGRLMKNETNNAKSGANMKSGEPTSCEDLRTIVYTLKGFYMIRSNALKVSIVYCDFTPEIVEDVQRSKVGRSITKTINSSSRFCRKIGSFPCSCYRSNYPVYQFELSNDELNLNALSSGPTQCKELEHIGHTLDGFYMVRSTSNVIKTVLCRFNKNNRAMTKTQPEEQTEKLQTTTFNRLESEKSVSLQSEDNSIEPPAAASTLKLYKMIDLKHGENRSYPLMNDFGKCLAVETNGTIKPSDKGAKIILADCDPSQKGQLWKYEDKPRTRLCNEWNKCLSAAFDVLQFSNKLESFDIIQGNPSDNYYNLLVDVNIYSQFNLFMLYRGYLGFKGNSDSHGAKAVTRPCNIAGRFEREHGTVWHFAWY